MPLLGWDAITRFLVARGWSKSENPARRRTLTAERKGDPQLNVERKQKKTEH